MRVRTRLRKLPGSVLSKKAEKQLLPYENLVLLNLEYTALNFSFGANESHGSRNKSKIEMDNRKMGFILDFLIIEFMKIHSFRSYVFPQITQIDHTVGFS